MIGELLDGLEEIEAEINRELASREILDSHDYSSSRYSGFDDGFNTGVEEATEQFRARVEKLLRSLVVQERPITPARPRAGRHWDQYGRPAP